jgi:hypothetical protein
MAAFSEDTMKIKTKIKAGPIGAPWHSAGQ